MAESDKYTRIPGRLHSVTMEGITTGADEVMDDALQKRQSELNRVMLRGSAQVVNVSSNLSVSEMAVESSHQVDVIYENTSQTEVTVTIGGGSLKTPDGGALSLSIPAGGYGEANFMNVGGTVYVRGC